MKILRVKRIKQRRKGKDEWKIELKCSRIFWGEKKKKKKRNICLFFFCHLSEQARLLSNKWKRKLRSENEKIPKHTCRRGRWKWWNLIFPRYLTINLDWQKKLIKRYNKLYRPIRHGWNKYNTICNHNDVKSVLSNNNNNSYK